MKGKVNAFLGTHNMGAYRLGNVSSGRRVLGNISGIVTGYDYKDIYSIYGLPFSKSTSDWVEQFKKDEDQTELKEAFHRLKPINKMHSLNFWVQGNDTNIQDLNIHFGVIRLQLGTEVKDFVVLNNISASATAPPRPGMIIVPYGGFFPFAEAESMV